MTNFSNNFQGGFPGNFGPVQKAIMAGLLGNYGGQNGAYQALSFGGNGLPAGVLANVAQNGAYQALSGGQNAHPAAVTGNGGENGARGALYDAQNPRHRCNLNLEEHQKYADALVSAGIIDKTTGESIKQKMAAVFRAESGTSAVGGAECSVPADFSGSEFLKARECLLQYLQNLDVELTSDDLAKIEAVVLELEKTAIARNSGASSEDAAADGTYRNAFMANEAAKERLMSSSLGSNGVKGLPHRTFTRDEIAKMSTAEFIKHEPQINYQLQNGLL